MDLPNVPGYMVPRYPGTMTLMTCGWVPIVPARTQHGIISNVPGRGTRGTHVRSTRKHRVHRFEEGQIWGQEVCSYAGREEPGYLGMNTSQGHVTDEGNKIWLHVDMNMPRHPRTGGRNLPVLLLAGCSREHVVTKNEVK